MRRPGRRALLIALAALALVTVGGCFWLGGKLAAPARRVVGPPPAGLDAEAVELASRSGSLLRGWFLGGDPGRGGVVLLHGIRADRRSMIGRARFLNEAGFALLLVDLQAHGESEGERITFGHLESRDAHAAVAFLRDRLPGEPVAALGSSLGGAACLLGESPVEVDALILEAVYPDVETAIANRLRMRLGPPGAWLTPLFTAQLRLRGGISARDLQPTSGIASLACPVLVLGGTEDRHTTPEDTRRLFEAAPEPRELWLVEGATHVDLHRFAGERYEERILAFLEGHLARRK
jgi:pimeloyl-ACP methyl ester carboxylesterase